MSEDRRKLERSCAVWAASCSRQSATNWWLCTLLLTCVEEGERLPFRHPNWPSVLSSPRGALTLNHHCTVLVKALIHSRKAVEQSRLAFEIYVLGSNLWWQVNLFPCWVICFLYCTCKDTLLWYSCCICDLYVGSDVWQKLRPCRSNDLQHIRFRGQHLWSVHPKICVLTDTSLVLLTFSLPVASHKAAAWL